MGNENPSSFQSMTLQYQSGVYPALEDLKSGLNYRSAWLQFSKIQIENKYRRTVLGPLWISIQRGIFIVGLTFIFGSITSRPTEDFLPYVAAGFIIFGLITSTLNNSAVMYTTNPAFLRSSGMPVSILHYRQLATLLIQFLHDALVLISVFIITGITQTNLILSICGFALLVINLYSMSLWIAPLSTKYRDVVPLIQSLSSILFFATPIFWKIEDIGEGTRTFFVHWNPFSYLLEIVRSSLLGMPIQSTTWLIAAGVTLLNIVIGFGVFAFSRNRIRYWM